MHDAGYGGEVMIGLGVQCSLLRHGFGGQAGFRKKRFFMLTPETRNLDIDMTVPDWTVLTLYLAAKNSQVGTIVGQKRGNG